MMNKLDDKMIQKTFICLECKEKYESKFVHSLLPYWLALYSIAQQCYSSSHIVCKHPFFRIFQILRGGRIKYFEKSISQ